MRQARNQLLYPSNTLCFRVRKAKAASIPPPDIAPVLEPLPLLLGEQVAEGRVSERDSLDRSASPRCDVGRAHLVRAHLHLSNMIGSASPADCVRQLTKSLASRMVRSYPSIIPCSRFCASARKTASHCASFDLSPGGFVALAARHWREHRYPRTHHSKESAHSAIWRQGAIESRRLNHHFEVELLLCRITKEA